MMAEMNGESIDQLLIDTSTELTKMTLHGSSSNNGSNGVSIGGGGKNCLKRLTSNPASPTIQKLTSSSQASPNGGGVGQTKSPINDQSLVVKSNGQYHNSSTKLGSDGESGEPSPDCSLSPVEVDSLEGGSSRDSSTCDRRSSPDYVNCTNDDVDVDVGVVGDEDDGFRDCESSPDVGISGCRPVDEESSSISPEIMTPVATITTNNNLNNHRRNLSSSSSPVIGKNSKSSLSSSPVSSSPVPPPPPSFPKITSTPKLSNPSSEIDPKLTSATESGNVTEPDSLEEFIKHETECAESNSVVGANQIDEVLIDSLGDSGSCQIFSTSPSTSSSIVDAGELLLSPTTTSDYKLVDSGVNLSDDLLLIVDCSNSNNSDSKLNLMTNNLISSSSSSHNNNIAIKDKNFPGKKREDDIINVYDNHHHHHHSEHVVDNDSVDKPHDVHNQTQNGVGITENSGASVASQLKGINTGNTFGDGIVRPTIIGQLAKPSDEESRSSMTINVSESNIIEVKSPLSLSSSSSPRDSKLSVINEPASMMVNYDENEHLSHNSSPLLPDETMNVKKQSLHVTSSSPICDNNTIKSPSPRPLAGIVGKQTGKIVKRESSLPVTSSSSSSSSSSSGAIKSTAESMIAEEIRQLKEREEELARMRASMSKHQGSTLTSSTTSLQNPYPHQQHFNGANHLHHHHHHHQQQHHPHHNQHQPLGKSTPSHCSSIDGKSSPALSDLSSCSVGTISNDSIDPVPSKPISLEILSGKVSGLIGESPIEREIRIAREREAELKAQVQLTRCLSNSVVSSTNDSQQQLPTSTTTVTKGSNVDIIANNNNTNGVGNDNGPLIIGKSLSTVTDETIVTSTGTKLPVFKQNSCGAANAADIQKLLATTRIQQEIEEQTQRELALKATGSIKTISQERTDLKVTKLTDIDKAGSTYSSITQINAISPPTTTTTVSSSTLPNNIKATVNIEPQTAKNIETSSGGYNTNGLTGNNVSNNQHGSNGLVSSSLVNATSNHHQQNHNNHVNSNNVYASNQINHVNIIQTNSINKPITSTPPSSSTVSSSSLSSSSSSSSSSSTITTTPTSATITTIRRTGFQPFMKKGLTKSISMHKFISSKGKTATPTGNPTSSPFYPIASSNDLYGGELRPPIMVKGDKGFRRGSVSAESKIQEELKEMKAREEELRRQRARLMGLSQPNLNLIGRDAGDDDDDDNDADHPHHGNDNYHDVNNGDSGSAGRNGSLYEIDAGLKRTISNPNIISHDDDKKVCQQFGNSLKPRKNPLIAQWEKKIIKDNPEPRF